jgi:hypothetical protein
MCTLDGPITPEHGDPLSPIVTLESRITFNSRGLTLPALTFFMRVDISTCIVSVAAAAGQPGFADVDKPTVLAFSE